MSSVDDIEQVKKRLREHAGKGASKGKAGRAPITSIAKVESDRGRKNSRVKGNRAELDVAEMFSRWSGEVVRRTPGSGGWSNAKFGVTADLVCANRAFPYSVEVKHRENWVLDDLVTGVRREHDKSIVQWWKQCVDSCPRDAARQRDGIRRDAPFAKLPLLVFRRNRQPWLVMMSEDTTCQGGVGVGLFEVPCSPLIRIVKVMLLEVFLDLEPVPEGLKNYKED